MKKILFALICWGTLMAPSFAQENTSIARKWNEVLLEAIRNDQARPTVHARNLFHVSAAMYDAWAIFDEEASPYFMGQIVQGFAFPFGGMPEVEDVEAVRQEAISYAAYRLIKHRFANAPRPQTINLLTYATMVEFGYDTTFTSLDYSSGSGAALGNYIAQKIIEYGLQDGSNEIEEYANRYYQPANEDWDPRRSINLNLDFPNRWQPLAFDQFIDQSGTNIGTTPPFLSPEWGGVNPFSLQPDAITYYERDNYTYQVYHDPGPPPYLEENEPDDDFRRGFMKVLEWSGHLDPSDGVMWDISPGANSNMWDLPEPGEDVSPFYDVADGPPGEGHAINPHTGQPYEPNVVPRGDFTRILAEFWADGPDSETPPGHWFTILNYVMDQDEFRRTFKGQGEELDLLEYQVKAYFTLGGAMHDVAVAAWSIKGWYDYVRPISILRHMASTQSESPGRFDYRPYAFERIPDYLERIEEQDTSILEWTDINPAINWSAYRGQWKVRAWRGHSLLGAVEPLVGGVGWVPFQEWWPYQRISFVTPNFGGYISGHSTFSRAAAEVLTLLTGDPFFPGGMGEFPFPQRVSLVFERGPSQDVTLQWASYRDAADQSALSRIWGGIHPPADDIPGRRIGEKVGKESFTYAEKYFRGEVDMADFSDFVSYFPNPVSRGNLLNVKLEEDITDGAIYLYDLTGRKVFSYKLENASKNEFIPVFTDELSQGIYLLKVQAPEEKVYKIMVR
ncbi:MAG: DUF6851 domain-containing protein [Bacteroidota bacterium]